MRRFVLGTAGHVDHGKTTLVRALTGVDTDRLPEEKKRGITIELGFAPWKLDGGFEVSLIDVPGHRRLVHTMIAGASGMELVLLVVAADEGVMPQTREHVAACELLGVRRAVVAVTKIDRVDADVVTLASEEALELLGGRFEVDVVPCSAKTGQGLDELRAVVRRALLALPPRQPSARARLSVDRAFSVRGAGTVVTGTLVEGRIGVGAPLRVVSGSGAIETSARGLHVHDRAVQLAEAPTRLALNLAGVALEAVRRGDVVTSDPRVRATRRIDVALRGGAEIRRGAIATVYVGTGRSAARIEPLGEVEGDAPPPGTKGAKAARAEATPVTRIARLRLSKPIVAVGGDRFVLRGSDVDGPSGAVLGGGTVLDAYPPARRPRDKRKATLAAMAKSDAAGVVRALVDEAAPRPLEKDAFAARFPIAEEALRRAADSLAGKGEIVVLKAHGWMSPTRLAALAATARQLVAEHHRAAPLDRGFPLETLRQKLAESAGPDAAEEAIRLAAAADGAPGKPAKARQAGEPIVVAGDVARLASFGAAAVDGLVGGALAKAMEAVREAGLKGVTEFAVKEASGASPKDVKAILAKLVRDSVAVHTGELWFSRTAFDALRTRVAAHLTATGRLTIAEFKDLSGLGRRQAIVLLEQLDREGVTRREGDDRLPGSHA